MEPTVEYQPIITPNSSTTDELFRFISKRSPLIIMICGKKCVGKSTAATAIAKALVDNYNVQPRIISLGANVKRVFIEMASLFELTTEEYHDVSTVDDNGESVIKRVYTGKRVPITDEHIADRQTKESMRKYLQTIGSDIMRNMIHKDIWTLSAHEKIKQICDEYDKNDHPVIIIDDIRYQNELDYFKRHFCYTISILLHKSDNSEYDQNDCVVDRNDMHESETQEINANFVYEVDKPLHIFAIDMAEFINRFVVNMTYCKYERCVNVEWKSRDAKDDEIIWKAPETWVMRE